MCQPEVRGLPTRGLRRVPTQARSRKRVEQILEAAAALLEEGGPDALRPTVVARRAEVPESSVYQYFADKGAILQVLVDRYFARVRDLMLAGFAGRKTLPALLDGLAHTADAWLALHNDEPHWGQVLAGILGDRELQALNIRDSQANARMLARAVLSAAPHAVPEVVETSALVVNHLFAAALQLALAEPTPERQRAVMNTWLGMAGAEILRVVAPPGGLVDLERFSLPTQPPRKPQLS